MTRVEVFRTGTHQPMNGDPISFGLDDLRQIADGYSPTLHEAPVVIGHPKTDDPAFGWVKGLSVQGQSLFADLDRLQPGFVDQVTSGAYGKVSIALYPPEARGNPAPGKFYLRHVGFLGATPPAVKGLAPVTFADADKVAVFVTVRGNPVLQALAALAGSDPAFGETGQDVEGAALALVEKLRQRLDHADATAAGALRAREAELNLAALARAPKGGRTRAGALPLPCARWLPSSWKSCPATRC